MKEEGGRRKPEKDRCVRAAAGKRAQSREGRRGVERGRGREKAPAGRAAFSESRGNSVWQGGLKGEHSGKGPRLSAECAWHHPIKPAHLADVHVQNRRRHPPLPPPSPIRKAEGCVWADVRACRSGESALTLLRRWSSQGQSRRWRQRAPIRHAFLPLGLIPTGK